MVVSFDDGSTLTARSGCGEGEDRLGRLCRGRPDDGVRRARPAARGAVHHLHHGHRGDASARAGLADGREHLR
jgi:hypothetical protein